MAILNWYELEEYAKADISFKVPRFFHEHLSGVLFIFIHSSFMVVPIFIAPYLYPTLIEAPLTIEPGVTEDVMIPEVVSIIS